MSDSNAYLDSLSPEVRATYEAIHLERARRREVLLRAGVVQICAWVDLPIFIRADQFVALDVNNLDATITLQSGEKISFQHRCNSSNPVETAFLIMESIFPEGDPYR